MKQLVVELSEENAGWLQAIASAGQKAPDEVVQQALAMGLSLLRARMRPVDPEASKAALAAGFGIWKNYPETPADGLAYQLEVRPEWP
jgi:hypothetical protein